MYQSKNQRIMRLPEVKERVGLSRSTIYQMMEDEQFPASVNLGGRSVGWVEGEINNWIEERISKRA